MKNARKISNQIKIGKLYHIEIPEGKRLIFDSLEYYKDDVFLMLSKPLIVEDSTYPKNFYYLVKVLVREQIIDISFLEHQAAHFKEIKVKKQ